MTVEKPTVIDIQSLLTRLREHYSEMHQKMSEDDKFYDQSAASVSMLLPDGVPVHVPSTATNIVDNMADQIRTDAPSIELRPRTESDREKVARLKRWALDRLTYIRNWSEIDAFEQAKRDLILRGAACVKILINEEVLPDVPVRASFESKDAYDAAVKDYEALKSSVEPYVTRPIDPLLVFPAPGARRPLKYIIEVQRRTVVDMQQFQNWTDPVGKKLRKGRKAERLLADSPTREVEWIEYWSDASFTDGGRYIVEVDGDRVIDEPNPNGFVPYEFDYSGLGRAHADGNPVHLSVGLLSKIHGELSAEIRIKTAWDAQWQYHVFPTLLVQRNSAGMAKQMQVGPGQIIEWGPHGNEPPQWLEKPPPDATMVTFLDRIEGGMRRVAGPVLEGTGAGMSEFGILEAMRIGQALKVVSPIVRTLNRMGSNTVSMMARLALRRNLTFKIRSSADREVTLDGGDFDRNDFQVSFEAVDQAENDRRLLVGESLHDKRLLSRRSFHEKYGKSIVDDPDEEAAWILSEDIERQALESGVLLQAALQGIKTQVSGGAAQLPPGGSAAGGITEQAAVENLAGSPGLTNAVQQAQQTQAGIVAGGGVTG